MEVVTATLAGDAVHVDARGREDPLPSPGSARVRVLAEERAGQLDPAGAVPEVAFVLPAHPLEVPKQVCLHRGRQHGGAILMPLAVADGELVRCEVHVLHPQATAFQQPQPGAIQQDRHEPRDAIEALEDGADLLARHDDGEPLRALRAYEVVEPGQLDAEHVAVQEQQGTQGLVLRGRRNLVADRERRQEFGDLGRAHLRRMAFAVEEDVPFGPVHIRLLGTTAEMASPHGVMNSVEEAGRGRWTRAGLSGDRAVGRRCRIRAQRGCPANHVKSSVEPGPR